MSPSELEFAGKIRAARARAAGLGAVDAGQIVGAAQGLYSRGVVGALVPSITIKTQVSPDLNADMTAAGAGQKGQVTGGDPVTAGLLGIVKPAFYAQTAAGPIVLAPYGVPASGKYFWLFVAGAAVFSGLAIYGGYKLARKVI